MTTGTVRNGKWRVSEDAWLEHDRGKNRLLQVQTEMCGYWESMFKYSTRHGRFGKPWYDFKLSKQNFNGRQINN